MPRCPWCQTEFNQSANFCENCGVELNATIESGSNVIMNYTSSDPVVGSLFASRYQILEKLGFGGMSRVYKAKDIELDEFIALKILRPQFLQDKHSSLRFKREIKLARRIKHPNVCTVFDLVLDAHSIAICMEYIDGVDLLKMIAQTRIPESKHLLIFSGIALGLKAAHDINVLHCDLKPSNVMIDDFFRPIITDFGIARYIGSPNDPHRKTILGTPAYMSPEQFTEDPIDRRSDIYSLGVTIFELLTSTLPFMCDTPVQYAIMHAQEPFHFPENKLSNLDPFLVKIIKKCLEKNPADRYQSVDALLNDLQTIASNAQIPIQQKRNQLILVADDDEFLRKAVEQTLESKGFEVVGAKNGEEAVKLVYKQKPDLILMDLMMPHMDGFTAAQILSKNSATAQIPIFLITAIDDKANRAFSRTIGIKEYIAKPYNFDDLLAKIKLHLSISSFY
jgi:serine/threonine protein kinase